jgi:hypothetical protein
MNWLRTESDMADRIDRCGYIPRPLRHEIEAWLANVKKPVKNLYKVMLDENWDYAYAPSHELQLRGFTTIALLAVATRYVNVLDQYCGYGLHNKCMDMRINLINTLHWINNGIEHHGDGANTFDYGHLKR